MTPTERAEEIVTKFNGEGACLSNSDETYLQELIATALTEARAEGFRECQEKAFQLACLDYDRGWNRMTDRIAKEIRALAPEEK